MDRPIEKRKWTVRRLAAGVASAVVVASLAYLAIFASTGETKLIVDADRTTVAQVTTGQFEEYVPIMGDVQPKTSVFLDLEEGGIVQQVHIEAGNPVEPGDLILQLSNTAVQKQNIDSETRLLENLDRLRNSQIALTEKELLLKEELLNLDHEVKELSKTFERYKRLEEGASGARLSRQDFETAADDLAYLRDKRDLLKERMQKESELRKEQRVQIEQSIALVNRSLKALEAIREALRVTAPISGYLSAMNAEIGQSFARGERIGQIDQLDSFKVRADVDQYYISRVTLGQEGTFEFGGQTYRLRINKIYPEVTNDAFQVDMTFVGQPPDRIKRGQTLQIDLGLSQPRTTKMVSKGGFYRYTNGRWVYRVAEDGMSAKRVPIVSGRQNPRHFEILDGLEVGDWVITSSYEAFGRADVLSFQEPIRLDPTSPNRGPG